MYFAVASVDAELQQAFVRIDDHFAQMRGEVAQIRSKIAEAEERLDAKIEAAETRLLTAFRNWAQTCEVRARGTSLAVREFEERLGMIEERVAKLERTPRNPPDLSPLPAGNLTQPKSVSSR